MACKKARMHFHEIDGAEIGDDRHSAFRRRPADAAGKTEAAIDDGYFLRRGFEDERDRRNRARRFGREHEAPRRFHQPRRDQRFRAGLKHATRPRCAWREKRSAPGIRTCAGGSRIRTGRCRRRKLAAPPASSPSAIMTRPPPASIASSVAAVGRLLEKNKGLFHRLFGQGRADGRMRLADTSTEVRDDMQDLHAAATVVNSRVPPGASTFGFTETSFLNLSVGVTR